MQIFWGKLNLDLANGLRGLAAGALGGGQGPIDPQKNNNVSESKKIESAKNVLHKDK